MAKRWDNLEECRDCMQQIRLALGNYHNGRGGPVYGLGPDAIWRKLRRADLRRGIPEGWNDEADKWFVLRRAEVRDE